MPAIPADVLACLRDPTDPPARKLTDDEVERYWNTDRYSLAVVNGCLHRLVCQYQDVRKDIGSVHEQAVCATPNVPTEQTLRTKKKK